MLSFSDFAVLKRPVCLFSAIAVFATGIALPLPSEAGSEAATCPFVDSAVAARAVGAAATSVAITATGRTQTCTITSTQTANRLVVTAVRHASPDEAISYFRFTSERSARTGTPALPVAALGDEAVRLDRRLLVRVAETIYTIELTTAAPPSDTSAREIALGKAIVDSAHVAVLSTPTALSTALAKPSLNGRPGPPVVSAQPNATASASVGRTTPLRTAPVGPPPAKIAAVRPLGNGPIVLPATHRLFSATIGNALSIVGVSAARVRASFVPPAGLEQLSAVALVDDTYVSGAFECADKDSADALRVEETPTYLIATIACARATYRAVGEKTGKTGAHRLSIAYRKAAIALKFEPATGVSLRTPHFVPNSRLAASAIARDPYTRVAKTKDELELAGCIGSFARYRKGEAGYFHAIFYTRIFHCEADTSREHDRALRSLAIAGTQRVHLRVNGISPADAATLYAPEYFFTNGDNVAAAKPIYHEAASIAIATASVPGGQQGIVTNAPALVVAYGARDKAIARGIIQFSTNPFAGKAGVTKNVPAIAHGLAGGVLGAARAVVLPSAFANAQSAQPPKSPDPCPGYLAPPNLAWQQIGAPVTYGASVKGQMASQIDDRPYAASAKLSTALVKSVFAALRASTNAADVLVFVRVVPVTDATGDTCAAAPTTWLPVAIHDSYPKALADATARTNAEAAKSVFAGNDGKKGSPIAVSFLSYVPPLWPTSEQLSYLVTNSGVASGILEGRGIKGGSWGGGCAFSPDRVIAWSHEDHSQDETFLERSWDGIATVFAQYVGMIDMLESLVVDGATTLLSAGKCPFREPFATSVPPDSTACADLRGGCRLALDAALAYAGFPASGGTAAAVLEEGASYARATAAEYVASAVADPLVAAAAQYAADKGIDSVRSGIADKLTQETLLPVHCTDPGAARALGQFRKLIDPSIVTDPVQLGKNIDALISSHQDDPGLVDLLTKYKFGPNSIDVDGCAFFWTNPYTWGGWDPARNPHSAILWLRVTRNPTGVLIVQDQTIGIHDSSGMYDDQYVHVPLSTMGTSIDIPVVLEPNYDRYRLDPRVRQSFGTGFSYDVSLEQEFWMEESIGTFSTPNGNGGYAQAPAASVSFTATSSYEYFALPTPIGNYADVFWGSHAQPLTAVFGTEHQPEVFAPCRDGVV